MVSPSRSMASAFAGNMTISRATALLAMAIAASGCSSGGHTRGGSADAGRGADARWQTSGVTPAPGRRRAVSNARRVAPVHGSARASALRARRPLRRDRPALLRLRVEAALHLRAAEPEDRVLRDGQMELPGRDDPREDVLVSHGHTRSDEGRDVPGDAPARARRRRLDAAHLRLERGANRRDALGRRAPSSTANSSIRRGTPRRTLTSFRARTIAAPATDVSVRRTRSAGGPGNSIAITTTETDPKTRSIISRRSACSNRNPMRQPRACISSTRSERRQFSKGSARTSTATALTVTSPEIPREPSADSGSTTRPPIRRPSPNPTTVSARSRPPPGAGRVAVSSTSCRNSPTIP